MKDTQRKKDRENWWHYNWGKVLAGGIGLALGLHLVFSALTAPKWDLQVAIISKTAYPDEVLTALSDALSVYTTDLNGDGKARVEVVQFTINFDATDESVDQRRQSAAVSGLLADLRSNDTQVFFTDDPDGFSQSTGALRYRDGTLPADEVYPTWQETSYRWTDCPALTALALGEYDAYLYGGSGDAQTELSRLYIGSRGFWDGTHTAHPAEDEALWQALTEGAAA